MYECTVLCYTNHTFPFLIDQVTDEMEINHLIFLFAFINRTANGWFFFSSSKTVSRFYARLNWSNLLMKWNAMCLLAESFISLIWNGNEKKIKFECHIYRSFLVDSISCDSEVFYTHLMCSLIRTIYSTICSEIRVCAPGQWQIYYYEQTTKTLLILVNSSCSYTFCMLLLSRLVSTWNG